MNLLILRSAEAKICGYLLPAPYMVHWGLDLFTSGVLGSFRVEVGEQENEEVEWKRKERG